MVGSNGSELKPFAFADREYTQKYTKLEKLSRHTLEKYMPLLSVKEEQEVSNVLPEKFALMVDGWTCGSEHYIGVLAAYPSFQSDFNVVLLAFSTLFDETSQGSREQCDFNNYTLEQYGKSLKNVVALIADNCETKKTLSELCEVPLIGCYSQRLALAVRDYLKPNDHLICKINTMMGKHKYQKLAGQLRQYTSLKPLQFCKPRWLSKLEMLERYLQIKEYVVKIETLLNYLISPQEKVVIQTLTDSLASLKSKLNQAYPVYAHSPSPSHHILGNFLSKRYVF